MVENIKYYPKAYLMSDELKAFFTVITNNNDLQQQLFNTVKLSDVSIIAQKLGFKIHSSEIVKAQAGRVLAILDEKSDDIENLVSGLKPKTGAQWGRDGGGFLDNAGYWLLKLENSKSTASIDMLINKFLDQVRYDPDLNQQILKTKTFNGLAHKAKDIGFNLTAVELLKHQAQKILDLSDSEAENIADS